MSDISMGEGWWQASDFKWYPPELHPDYEAASTPSGPLDTQSSASEPQTETGALNPSQLGETLQITPSQLGETQTLDPSNLAYHQQPTTAGANNTANLASPGAGGVSETTNPANPEAQNPTFSPAAPAMGIPQNLAATPTTTESSQGHPKSKSKTKKLILIGALLSVLVIVAGFFVVKNFLKGITGAETPELATVQLFNSLGANETGEDKELNLADISSLSDIDSVDFLRIIDPAETSAVVNAISAYNRAVEATQPLNPEATSNNEQNDQINELTAEYVDFLEDLQSAFSFALYTEEDFSESLEVEYLNTEQTYARASIPNFSIGVVGQAEDNEVFVFGDSYSQTALFPNAINGYRLNYNYFRSGRATFSLVTPNGTPHEIEEFDSSNGNLVSLILVQRNERWYVSLNHSIAEAFLQLNSADDISLNYGYSEQVIEEATAGADTPQQALEQLLVATTNQDINGLVRSLDPAEIGVIYDYLDAANLENPEVDQPAEINIELSVTEDGDLAYGKLSQFSFKTQDSYSDEEISFSYTPSTGCIAASEQQIDGLCLDQVDDAIERLELPEDTGEQILTSLKAFLDDAEIVFTKHNDRWFVSPLATVASFSGTLKTQNEGFINLEDLEQSPQELLEPPFDTDFVNLALKTTTTGVTQNKEITIEPEKGFVHIVPALDTSYLQITTGEASFDKELDDSDSTPLRVGLMKVSSTQEVEYSFTYPAFAFEPLSSSDTQFAVIWDIPQYDPVNPSTLPASGATTAPVVSLKTDSPVTVEFISPEIVVAEVGLEGQISEEGWPVLLDISDLENFTVDGANSVEIWARGSEDQIEFVDLQEPSYFFFPTSSLALVYGDPGTSFTIVTDSIDNDFSEDNSNFDSSVDSEAALDPIFDRLLTWSEGKDATYDSEFFGGYFDGCAAGPDDPTAYTMAFENEIPGGYIVVTAYSSEKQAADQFAKLSEVKTPCSNFEEGFQILDVSHVEDYTIISWNFVDSPEPIYEQYRLDGKYIWATVASEELSLVLLNAIVEDIPAG